MPLPRYTPGTGNLGAAQPVLDDLGSAYNKGVDFWNNPGAGIRGMLGIPESPATHQGAIQQMNKHTNSHANDAANQSFQHPVQMQAPPNPVVAPPRRKPMM